MTVLFDFESKFVGWTLHLCFVNRRYYGLLILRLGLPTILQPLHLRLTHPLLDSSHQYLRSILTLALKVLQEHQRRLRNVPSYL